MSFFEELKRRKVFKVAPTYAVVAWILMQIGEVTFPALNIPDWVMSTLVFALLAGFPIAVIFAWIFDKTSQGLIKTDATETEEIDAMNVIVDARPFYLQKRNIILSLGVIGGILIGTYSGDTFKTSVDRKSIAVLPFDKFPSQNIFLSPEMRSTGEVIGFDKNLGAAYAKAEIGAGNILPINGTIFISVNDNDKNEILKITRDLDEMGFKIIATIGTSKLLKSNGISCENIYKVGEGRPNIVDSIKNNEINLIINTPLGAQSRFDEYKIGKSAIKHSIPVVTTIAAAQAAIRAIRILQNNSLSYNSLQNIFKSHD